MTPPTTKRVRERYKKAVDPNEVPKPITRLRDMTPEQKAELERTYGVPISTKPPKPIFRPPPEEREINGVKLTDLHPKCPNPDCDHYLMVRQGKFSLFYGCKGYPTCRTIWPCSPDGTLKGDPKIQ